MNSNHLRINYIEFQATDLEVVKDFYAAVFQWSFTDYGPDYVAFNDGILDGGFARGESNSSGAPLVIMYSTDLQATQNDIERHGGQITQPIFNFPGGRRFHFSDPLGNVLGVWSDQPDG